MYTRAIYAINEEFVGFKYNKWVINIYRWVVAIVYQYVNKYLVMLTIFSNDCGVKLWGYKEGRDSDSPTEINNRTFRMFPIPSIIFN